MNKKLLSGVTLLFAAAASIAIYSTAQSPTSRLTPAQLRNLEAVSQGEGGRPCDNFNGYKLIAPGKDRMRDCCYDVVYGSAKKECARW